MEDSFIQLGVGGIFVVLVLRMVFDFLQSRKDNGSQDIECRKSTQHIKNQLQHLVDHVDELHTWHAPNADGEQAWKNTRMINVLEELNKTIQHNSEVITDLRRTMQNTKK